MVNDLKTTKHSGGVQQSKKVFLCTYDNCEKSYTSLSHLNRHESVHTGKVYRCEECSTVFNSQYAQKRHTDNFHLKKVPKKYKCDLCGEDFNKKSWLNQHLFKHTGVKPYKCTFEGCDAKFLVPSKLRRHLKVHEGYVCPKENCDKKFSKWTEVRRHLKLAHPKMYRCPECDQEFSRSNNLRNHSIIHRSDRHVYLCPREGCDRFYSTNNNLIHHIKSYHEERPFNCTVGQCCRAFKSQEELDAHRIKHSPSVKLKKKKKQKPKASFAAELAGLALKKWQVDALKNASKPAGTELSPESDRMELPFDNLAKDNETATSSDHVKNCDEMQVSDDEDTNNNVLDLSDSDCVQNDDIQMLLNAVEKRNGCESESIAKETKCISVKT